MKFLFVPFGGRAPEASVACDGLVPGARIDLSHWSGNKTPARLKADTSVEIALIFAAERGAHDVDTVTNNHFDTDGVLAVWTALNPELALAHREVIIAAAECGDFDEWPSDDRGLELDAAIAALAGEREDRAAYARVLPLLDELVPQISAREDLWGRARSDLAKVERSIERGAARIERVGRIAIAIHQRGVEELPGPWLSRLAPQGIDRWLLAFRDDAGGGWRYRYELPRWCWADTVRRPKIPMPRRGPIRRTLGREWIVKGRRGMTGLAYTDRAISTEPLAVARAIAELDV